MQLKTSPQGIDVRHSRACPSQDGGKCTAGSKKPDACKLAYQAHVWSARDKKRIRKTFPTLSAAKAWRTDALSDLRKGKMRAPSAITLRESAEAWLEGARAGVLRTRGGEIYKPSVLRGYESALRRQVFPELGAKRLSEVTQNDVQDFADRLLASGLDPSSIRNTIMPLRVVYRRAVKRCDVLVNPTRGLELATPKGKRDRIASPEEAARLLEVLPDGERAAWATAFYAGLRVGELFALRWEDVDFERGIIRVRRAYDPKERQYIEVKSTASERNVPIPFNLRRALRDHQSVTGRDVGLVFGADGVTPFAYQSHRRHAASAWEKANKAETEKAERENRKPNLLSPIGFHEARHTFASLMIAAGVNIKALSTYMGHASITITLDRYGHLLPGSESDAAEKLDAYLARATA